MSILVSKTTCANDPYYGIKYKIKLFLSTFILLFFISCNGQKSNIAEKNEPKVYTDADIVTSSMKDKKWKLMVWNNYGRAFQI
ncbi:MAG: hypothetical protein CMC08_10225 [Flavobacteriaceae bacterium]|nr:hypothetical protein [Flavobacteriaceae bacterium]|tara:strand:+ start:175 stop:423 length:249 start_codon:yes stop_codon:yes gene_type:complete